MIRHEHHDAEQRRALMNQCPHRDELTDHWGMPEDRPSAAVVWVVMAAMASGFVGLIALAVWWLL